MTTALRFGLTSVTLTLFNPLMQNQVVNNPKTLMADLRLLRGGIVAELSLNDCVIKYRN